MHTNTITQTNEENRTTFRSTGRLHRPAEVHARRRRIRITFAPRREACLTRRALLAALREAELAEWMASGGDYLARVHLPID